MKRVGAICATVLTIELLSGCSYATPPPDGSVSAESCLGSASPDQRLEVQGSLAAIQRDGKAVAAVALRRVVDSPANNISVTGVYSSMTAPDSSRLRIYAPDYGIVAAVHAGGNVVRVSLQPEDDPTEPNHKKLPKNPAEFAALATKIINDPATNVAYAGIEDGYGNPDSAIYPERFGCPAVLGQFSEPNKIPGIVGFQQTFGKQVAVARGQ